MQQFGVGDVATVTAIVSGMAILPTRAKPVGKKKGTSLSSIASRKIFGKTKFPYGKQLPTFIGNPVEGIRRKMVSNIGTFVGRSVPVVGWMILAYDVSKISAESVFTYNRIVRTEDTLMVEKTLEESVLSLIKKHYGTPIIGRHPDITLNSDIDTDLGIDWPESEELMGEFFKEFSVDKAGFNIETYYPNPPMRTLLKNMFSRKKDISIVPDFTVQMLIESAKAGRWLY